MASHLYLLAAIALLLLLGAFPGHAYTPRRQDSEEDLLARIQRERNLVKKAKFEVRLGRVKLLQAIEASEKGDLEQCQLLLDGYLKRMKSSWETLQSSGRHAARQPQGFKELEIALREEARLLEDLRHRIPYHDRGVVEKVAQEIDTLRDQVLKALFPALPSRGTASRRLAAHGECVRTMNRLRWSV
jgi:hypothetical protein